MPQKTISCISDHRTGTPTPHRTAQFCWQNKNGAIETQRFGGDEKAPTCSIRLHNHVGCNSMPLKQLPSAVLWRIKFYCSQNSKSVAQRNIGCCWWLKQSYQRMNVLVYRLIVTEYLTSTEHPALPMHSPASSELKSRPKLACTAWVK